MRLLLSILIASVGIIMIVSIALFGYRVFVGEETLLGEKLVAPTQKIDKAISQSPIESIKEFVETQFNSIKYTNESLGFSINLPKSWNNKYDTKILTSVKMFGTDQDGVDIIYFNYTPATKKPNIFLIGKTSDLTWQYALANEFVSPVQQLGHKDNSIFFYKISPLNPLGGENKKDFDQMILDTEELLPTFQLL